MRLTCLRCTPLLLTLACAEKGADSADGAALALWDEIQGYSAYEQHPDFAGIQVSEDGTHGPFVQVWLNPTAAGAAAGGGSETMPDGAIVVKEGYDDGAGTSLRSITVMKKVDGSDPDHGDWLYAAFTENGSVQTSGADAADYCSGCHSVGQDYIRAFTW